MENLVSGWTELYTQYDHPDTNYLYRHKLPKTAVSMKMDKVLPTTQITDCWKFMPRCTHDYLRCIIASSLMHTNLHFGEFVLDLKRLT